MKTSAEKSFIISVIIVIAVLFIVGGTYLYSPSKNTTPYFTKNDNLLTNYKILENENSWREKLIAGSIPMEWQVTEKDIVIKEVRQNKFLCENNEAQFTNYLSYNNGSVGGWNNISVIDCGGDYYFVYEFGDAGPKLYGPFSKE